MNDGRDSIITTLDEGCVVGIGCKVHTHHKLIEIKPQVIYQPLQKFTIFGHDYVTDQWGQTFEIPKEEIPETIQMKQTYASDTIKPTNSAFLIKPQPEAKIIIKPKTIYPDYQPTIDGPIMGMLLTFTIYLSVQWAINSASEWSKMFSEINQCLRSSS